MDQQPPSVWPPAPSGMTPTPQTEINSFKPAPILWVTWLTLFAAGVGFLQSLCDLGLGIDPKSSLFVALNSALAKPWNIVPTASWIAFFVWFHRVYKNLAQFGTAGLRYGPGWAVGWFFVPIFSLFRPYQIAQTIWKASTPGVDSRDIRAWSSVPGGGIVIGWWTLSVISNVMILGLAVSQTLLRLPSLSSHMISALVDLCIAAANIATILLIRAVSTRQLAKAAALCTSDEVAA